METSWLAQSILLYLAYRFYFRSIRVTAVERRRWTRYSFEIWIKTACFEAQASEQVSRLAATYFFPEYSSVYKICFGIFFDLRVLKRRFSLHPLYLQMDYGSTNSLENIVPIAIYGVSVFIISGDKKDRISKLLRGGIVYSSPSTRIYLLHKTLNFNFETSTNGNIEVRGVIIIALLSIYRRVGHFCISIYNLQTIFRTFW